jgi:DNA-binding transcriptional ArsR family regulator
MKNTYAPNLKKMPLSSIFDALSDPVRIEVVLALLEQKEVSCGECTRHVSKSTMSHHFKVLKEAGIIQKREKGTVHFLSLRLEELESRLPGFIAVLSKAKGPL